MNRGRIFLDLEGLSLKPKEIKLLESPAIAGILLFKRNYKNKNQLKELVKEIRSISPELILAVDHEGGQIQRFKKDFTKIPPAHFFGALYQKTPEKACSEALRYGEIMSSELIACGIDLSFAPVLDLHRDQSTIIGQLERSFHEDPRVVSILAKSFITGMNKAGMSACGKHFPGHGSVLLDSHLDHVIDDRTWDDLQADLHPFIELKDKLAALMPAHIIYPCKDPKKVVCRSAAWAQYLRQDLSYDHCIISDCLSMKGIHDPNTTKQGHSWHERIYQQVLIAMTESLNYCDLVIMSNIETLEEEMKPANFKEEKIKILEKLLQNVELAMPVSQKRIAKLKASSQNISL